jgi:hypothetical protein
MVREPSAPPAERHPTAPPIIALRMESLLTWTAERVAKFPRDHKFTIGDRLVEVCLDIMSNLVEASYKCLSESQQPPAESRRLPSYVFSG